MTERKSDEQNVHNGSVTLVSLPSLPLPQAASRTAMAMAVGTNRNDRVWAWVFR